MNKVLERIAHFATVHPQQPALHDGANVISYGELLYEIDRIASALHLRRVGLLLSNSCAWAILDLAIQQRGAACVPMPDFFSDAQLRHMTNDAALDLIITDQADRATALLSSPLVTEITVAGQKLTCLVLQHAEHRSVLPPHTTKITYTSGTTGQPKGVCLSDESVARVTQSLSTAVNAGPQDRTLSLLPLSTLLANIAGVYAPLYSGACAHLPDLAECGLSGSTKIQPQQLLTALHRHQPTVIVLVPQLLKILIEAVASGAALPASLRFIAVGGAPVSSALLKRARTLGVPVYQGYGLSEAGSVVSLNLPGYERDGSVGQPLPHVAVRIAADGEIMVSGNLFGAYLGHTTHTNDEWATGDLGHLDEDGFLYITGRKKTAYATAHGRKLNPEWIESELAAHACIAQAVLFGEGRPFNVAVIVPSAIGAVADITKAITTLNKHLPDYARVSRWIIAQQPFTPANGLGTAAGAPHRAAIADRYATQLEQLFEREPAHAVL